MTTDAHGVPLADCISPGKCAPSPATTILEQRNPTCDIRNYQGGQWACHHMWSLLDKEQPIPWADQPLVFQHKCAKVPSNATARPFIPNPLHLNPPPYLTLKLRAQPPSINRLSRARAPSGGVSGFSRTTRATTRRLRWGSQWALRSCSARRGNTMYPSVGRACQGAHGNVAR